MCSRMRVNNALCFLPFETARVRDMPSWCHDWVVSERGRTFYDVSPRRSPGAHHLGADDCHRGLLFYL